MFTLVTDYAPGLDSEKTFLERFKAQGGEIVECDVLSDRSGGKAALESPATGRSYALRSLWQLDLPTYEPGSKTCPRYADGTPLQAPGSTGAGTATGPS